MADVDKDRKEFWSSQPAVLDSMVLCDNPLFQEADTDYMVHYLPPIANKSVLELGAGIGRLTGEIAKKAKDITAVDFMQHFLDVNKVNNRHMSNITYICDDFTKFQTDKKYDLVVSAWLFVNTKDEVVDKMIGLVLEWLQPGGYFTFRESGPYDEDVPMRFKQNFFHHRTPFKLHQLLGGVVKDGHTLTITRCKNSRFSMKYDHDIAAAVTEVFYVAKKVPIELVLASTLPLTTISCSYLKMGVVAGWQVLVVGCGTGALVFHIASTYGADVLGVNFTIKDFNAAVIHQKCSPDIASLILFEMIVAVEEADYGAECFDVILIQETQLMMNDPTKLFANIRMLSGNVPRRLSPRTSFTKRLLLKGINKAELMSVKIVEKGPAEKVQPVA
ncbi:hypothetical protein Pcinc_018722 [Petrolisthes cinctipes]|uniref:phosphoethanolamine N-methyltransferase n=1 Tax=Petrolisthes cinctipes TaxID=88211 RepID=A0AAE1FLM8_PETCI|nr:hypothetical protein Pcinc_018722 [Petrolisthes cinctipes]